MTKLKSINIEMEYFGTRILISNIFKEFLEYIMRTYISNKVIIISRDANNLLEYLQICEQ